MPPLPATPFGKASNDVARQRMPCCVLILFAIGTSGCTNRPDITLAGGKPMSYWIEALHDKDPKARKAAATHIGNAAPSDSAAISALIEALKDPDPTVRCEVLLALMKCGSAAADAVPTITEMQKKDPSEQVRKYATKVLEKIRGGS